MIALFCDLFFCVLYYEIQQNKTLLNLGTSTLIRSFSRNLDNHNIVEQKNKINIMALFKYES